MESNGKSVRHDGVPVDLPTAPIIWGGVGTDAQHAFFQALHQGTQVVPVEFIGIIQPAHRHDAHHRVLLANLLAQSAALAYGDDTRDLGNIHVYEEFLVELTKILGACVRPLKRINITAATARVP